MGLRERLSGLTPLTLVSIFTLVNLFNYIDRGIVPGAFESLGTWIRGDLDVLSTDVQIGLLQSMYIVGYAAASVSFGHLVNFYDPFKLMAIGLGVWCVAVILSGLAPHFWVLVVARVLSGVGEASFQTVVPPYIDDNAPPAKRGLWLAAFFSAIPVGTAFGFVWGGSIASSLSWRLAFILQAVPMAPLVFLIWFLPSGRRSNPTGPTLSSTKTTNRALATAAFAAGQGEAAVSLISASAAKRHKFHNSKDQRDCDEADAGMGTEAGAGAGAGAEAGAGAGAGTKASLYAPLYRPHHPSRLSTTTHLDASANDDSFDAAAAESPVGVRLLLSPMGPSESVNTDSHSPGATMSIDEELRAPTFLGELRLVLCDPLYMSITLGYAAYTAVLAGIGSFGPTFVMVRVWASPSSSCPHCVLTRSAPPPPPPPPQGLGICDNQTESSLYFGIAVSIAGAIGTPLGGYLVDLSSRRRLKAIRLDDPFLAVQLGLKPLGAVNVTMVNNKLAASASLRVGGGGGGGDGAYSEMDEEGGGGRLTRRWHWTTMRWTTLRIPLQRTLRLLPRCHRRQF